MILDFGPIMRYRTQYSFEYKFPECFQVYGINDITLLALYLYGKDPVTVVVLIIMVVSFMVNISPLLTLYVLLPLNLFQAIIRNTLPLFAVS